MAAAAAPAGEAPTGMSSEAAAAKVTVMSARSTTIMTVMILTLMMVHSSVHVVGYIPIVMNMASVISSEWKPEQASEYQ